MRPSAIFDSSRAFRCSRIVIAAIGACVAAVMLDAFSSAATSPTARACPTAAIVKAELGLPAGAPVVTRTPVSKTCTYPGAGILGSTQITFQVDTAAGFASGEKAAGTFGAKITKVQHLGQAAWTTGLGSLYVFDGHETIKILALSLGVRSPSTATVKVEALARKLL
jgi:hypothetical protein